MQLPTLEDMLQAGVHFGHQTSKWNPKMAPFIFTKQRNIHVIDLEKTRERLDAAVTAMQDVVRKGGSVLMVGTKRQARPLVRAAAERIGMPFVTERWLGGTLTNYDTIKRQIARLHDLRKQRDEGTLKKYTKREQLEIGRDIIRLEKDFGGIADMHGLPQMMFVVDIRAERNAIAEARLKNIPIVALVDTNVDPDMVTYAIPSNDDAIKAITLMVETIANAIAEAKPQPVVSAPAIAPAQAVVPAPAVPATPAA